MNRVSSLLIVLLLLVGSTASAQTTDLRADSSTVVNPYQGDLLLVTVHVTNLGPETYNAGTMRITVDIDEPAKPGLPGMPTATLCSGSADQTLPVPPIPSGGSVSITLTDRVGICLADQVRITSTVYVTGGYTDPNLENNTSVDIVPLIPVIPSTNWLGLLVLGLAMIGIAALVIRRSRHAAS